MILDFVTFETRFVFEDWQKFIQYDKEKIIHAHLSFSEKMTIINYYLGVKNVRVCVYV